MSPKGPGICNWLHVDVGVLMSNNYAPLSQWFDTAINITLISMFICKVVHVCITEMT